jgi:serine/threonine protein kinase
LVLDHSVPLVPLNENLGYVFEAYDNTTNQRVAIKRIEKCGKSLSREYEILFDIMKCPHVIKILDFYYSKNSANQLIQNIVFEYMEDDLEAMIGAKRKQGQVFSQKEVKI